MATVAICAIVLGGLIPSPLQLSMAPCWTAAQPPAEGVSEDGEESRPDRGNETARVEAMNAFRAEVRHLLKSDPNDDGKLDFDELASIKPGYPRQTFRQLDSTGDGVLTEADADRLSNAMDKESDESLRAQVRRAYRRLADGDANGDGKITYEEAVKRMPRLTEEQFDFLDRDGDDAISRADIRRR